MAQFTIPRSVHDDTRATNRVVALPEMWILIAAFSGVVGACPADGRVQGGARGGEGVAGHFAGAGAMRRDRRGSAQERGVAAESRRASMRAST
jgi:hypothetical protein